MNKKDIEVLAKVIERNIDSQNKDHLHAFNFLPDLVCELRKVNPKFDGYGFLENFKQERVYVHTPDTHGRLNTDLDNYAEGLAEQTFNHFIIPNSDNEEPFDGDETEYLSKRYLYHLDGLMGNR